MTGEVAQPTQAAGVSPLEQHRVALATVSALLFAVTVSATLIGVRIGRTQTQQRLEHLARDHVELVSQRVRAPSNLLHALRGAFVESPDLSRVSFSRIIQGSSALERGPGLRALEFVRRVERGEVETFERRVRSEATAQVSADFAVHGGDGKPPSEDVHYVVDYVEPLDGNEAALGLDLGFEPVRRQAVERAAASTDTMVSGVIRLVQASGSRADGMLMLLAVPAPATPVDPEPRVLGLLAAIVELDALVPRLSSEHVAFTVFDLGLAGGSSAGLLDPPAALHRRPAAWSSSAHRVEHEVERGGRTWRLVYAASPEFATFAERVLPGLVFVACLLSSSVIFAMVLRLARSQDRQRRLAWRLAQKSEEMKQLALHDPLTGLPNRVLFTEQVEHALTGLTRSPGLIAVLFLDLDEFKSVNDRLGHAAGDQLLEEVGRRIRSCVRKEDTPARIGGDEFSILCENVAGDEEAVALAERVVEALAPSCVLGDEAIHVKSSIGVVLTGDALQTAESLLREADEAMYFAKREGGGRVRLLDHRLRASIESQHRLRSELRAAVRNKRLQVLYQPIIRLEDGAIVGFEALARWASFSQGAVTPRQFIPMAESLGLLDGLFQNVLQQAVRDGRAAKEAAGRPVTLWINVSARQLERGDLAGLIRDSLTAEERRSGLIGIEVTDGAWIEGSEAAASALKEIHELGVQLAIDDFGSEASTFGTLRRLPVDAIKIDGSVVQGLGGEHENALFEAILRLAGSFQLAIIAKGVQTARQDALVREAGCTFAQGVFYAPPVECSQLARLAVCAPHEPSLPEMPGEQAEAAT